MSDNSMESKDKYNSPQWEITRQDDHTFETTSLYHGHVKAYVKWDGCVDMWWYPTEDENDSESHYLHFCSFPKEVERMSALLDLCKQIFNKQEHHAEFWED